MPAISVFVCGRRTARPSCSTNGCTGQVRVTCDFALSGKKAGQFCDRALCAGCVRRIEGKDFCRAHAGIVDPGGRP